MNMSLTALGLVLSARTIRLSVTPLRRTYTRAALSTLLSQHTHSGHCFNHTHTHTCPSDRPGTPRISQLCSYWCEVTPRLLPKYQTNTAATATTMRGKMTAAVMHRHRTLLTPVKNKYTSVKVYPVTYFHFTLKEKQGYSFIQNLWANGSVSHL